MNWEHEAWSQLKNNAEGNLKPEAALRAIHTAGLTRQRQRRDTLVAASLAILLTVGLCATSYVQASTQQAKNEKLWDDAIVAQYAVTRSL